MAGVLIRREDYDTAQKDDHVRTQQQGGHMQAQDRGLKSNNTAGISIMDLRSAELWGNTFLLLKPSSLWSSVMVALEY